MKKLLCFFIFILVMNLQAQDRPKLVVGIVVDQMKMDYLYRFSSDFTNDGFKRLMNNGYVFHNMNYNYMPTFTAPGHASIYSGTTPSIHGIVGNEWYSRKQGKEVYCTDDASVKTIGNGTKAEGEMSPKKLLTTTITDELRLATNFNGKVIGMSLKDRGAILPAGHFANWAFWYSKTGAFVSSTFYGEKLPDWVTQFNDEKLFMTYINKGWDLLKPIETYNESLADENPYEGKLNGANPVFPYNLKEMLEKKNAEILRATPFGNDLLAEFAKKAIENEELGKDAFTDFLAVSFSSTDYVGHNLGPRSIEVQDVYLRLDLTIADFLNYLDKTVGKGNYLVFLTADHAGAENPLYLKDKKYNVDNVFPKDILKGLKKFSVDAFGEDLVVNCSNFNLFFNKEIIKTKGLELPKVKQAFKEYLMTQEQVKRAYTEEEILASNGTDFYLDCIAKGYDATEDGDMVILNKPGYIDHFIATGTDHGTPYSYDTHVPLIFYGWNIPKGETHDHKVITQIAPTLAQKIKVAFPNGTEGKVLLEVLDK